jgi:hypothetical protein
MYARDRQRTAPSPRSPSAQHWPFPPARGWVEVARTAAERRARSVRYGGSHRRVRRRWAPKVRAGKVTCSRCGERIEPWQRWDLDHADDGDPRSYLGPAHARCNRASVTHLKQRLTAAEAASTTSSREW